MTPTNTIRKNLIYVLLLTALRQVTIILRYYPEHAEAMEPLKEWVRDFQITP